MEPVAHAAGSQVAVEKAEVCKLSSPALAILWFMARERLLHEIPDSGFRTSVEH